MKLHARRDFEYICYNDYYYYLMLHRLLKDCDWWFFIN